ncbi:zinc ribbon domain-containing protein [Nostoc sp.]|uniref:zinc ribbon domain-containing protein n=1 Tax=Nostoc sp. TaxID=1180 RepID=UPI002FF94609
MLDLECPEAPLNIKSSKLVVCIIEVPARQVKPSQTCPKCANQHKKTLDIRVHECGICNYVQDRDIAAAEVMLYWAKGTLPGLGISVVGAESSSSTSHTPKLAGSMKQLGAKKHQKSQSNFVTNDLGNVETPISGEARLG